MDKEVKDKIEAELVALEGMSREELLRYAAEIRVNIGVLNDRLNAFAELVFTHDKVIQNHITPQKKTEYKPGKDDVNFKRLVMGDFFA